MVRGGISSGRESLSESGSAKSGGGTSEASMEGTEWEWQRKISANNKKVEEESVDREPGQEKG
jgi:hypothetical protein